MNVFYNLDELPIFKNAVVTIGTFDGVHEGHKKILHQLKTEAKAVDGETIVITFHPHPRNIVGDTTGVKLLTTLEEKIALLEKQNIDNLIIVPFTNEFANLSAEDYVTQFLHKKFKPRVIIIGYDHRFGKNRKGNYQLLEQYGKVLGFVVKEINQQVLKEITISSTQVRKALLQTDLVTAQNLLGYEYFFEGTVIKGDQIGRTIGYPTANIQLNNEDKLVPGDGVYAVVVERSKKTEDGSQETEDRKQKTEDRRQKTEDRRQKTEDRRQKMEVGSEKLEDKSSVTHNPKFITQNYLQGMMYIGSRPVVNGKRRVIEINLFNFNEDIYTETLRVVVKKYIRGDIHFNGLEGLKNQLALDKIAVGKVLNP